jgi:hypothetical protein
MPNGGTLITFIYRTDPQEEGQERPAAYLIFKVLDNRDN